MFETSLKTVTKIPDSELAKLFSREDDDDVMMTGASHQRGEGEVVNIDCDPEIFRVILQWLRCGIVSAPEKLNRKVLKLTATQLGLHDLTKELEATEEFSADVKRWDNDSPDNENGNEVAKMMDNKSMTDWLRLNVGGTIFETSRSTLTSDSDSILSRMFEPNSNLPPATVNKDGVFMIDACPRGFEVVLNYLRYRKLILGDCNMEDVLPVADYFGLGELREMLEAKKEKEENDRGKGQSCMESCTDRIEEVLQNIENEFTSLNEKIEDFKMEVASVATGVEELWRVKCELSTISGVLSEGLSNKRKK